MVLEGTERKEEEGVSSFRGRDEDGPIVLDG
jgi:hypothetical protein